MERKTMPDRVKEKLVEIIQNSVGGCARHWAEVIADGLIAHGVTVQDNTQITDELLEQLRNTPVTILQEEPTIETVQEWISVKDRLPEDDSDVLAYLRIGEESRIYPANYAKGMWFDCIFNTPNTESTTHWMPLPQPPKGE